MAQGKLRARRRSEGGAVTMEAAIALPALVLVALAMCWLIAFGVAEARAVDAAREVARGLARGDAREDAVAVGRQIAPAGARVRIEASEGVIRVEVVARLRGPGGALSLPGFTARGTAVAVQEAGG